MTRISPLNLRRILAGVLLLLTVFAMVNYYFDLGVLRQHAKGLVILSIGLAVVYGLFLAPTRKEMDEYRQSRRDRKKTL